VTRPGTTRVQRPVSKPAIDTEPIAPGAAVDVRGEQAAASAAISDTPHRVLVGRLGLEPT
jgi:hypothetical protein